ncbi:MAG: winged helix-turn-helix domain-containing protein [Patescibacteria group bacterium]
MNGLFFTSRVVQGPFFDRNFRSENLSLSILGPPFSFSPSLSSYNVFLFYAPLAREITDFIAFLKQYRPDAVTGYLFDEQPSSLPDTDFVFVRPFSFRQMSFSLQEKYFEKQKNRSSREVLYAETTLNLFTREVCKHPYRLSLRSKEFSLLQLFMLNPGKVFTRSDLLELIWDSFATVSTNTVDVHVARLRKKLKECGSSLIIKTIPCVGYILH